MAERIKRPEVDGLVFEPVSHSFFWRGTRIPSVTSMLKEVGIVPNYYTPESGNRGRIIHERMAAVIDGKVKIPQVDMDIQGFCEAEQEYLSALGVKKIFTEVEVMGLGLMYAGICDRWVWTKKGDLFIVEYKSGDADPYHLIQLGGYVMAAKHMGFKPKGGLLVYVRANGSWFESQEPPAIKTWDAVRTVWYAGWRRRRGNQGGEVQGSAQADR